MEAIKQLMLSMVSFLLSRDYPRVSLDNVLKMPVMIKNPPISKITGSCSVTEVSGAMVVLVSIEIEIWACALTRIVNPVGALFLVDLAAVGMLSFRESVWVY